MPKKTKPPVVTIDDALALLKMAKRDLGGARCLILSLSGSELEDVDVTELAVFKDGESGYVEVRVTHPALVVRDDVPARAPVGSRVSMAGVAETMAHFNLSDGDWDRTPGTVQETLRRYLKHRVSPLNR